MTTDGPTPRDTIVDLTVALDHDAEQLAARTLRLAAAHDAAVARAHDRELPAPPAKESDDPLK